MYFAKSASSLGQVLPQIMVVLFSENCSINGAAPFTVTLPATVTADGGEILVKKVGNQTVTIAAANIEGTNQTIEITNNQAIRLVYVNATFGWLIT